MATMTKKGGLLPLRAKTAVDFPRQNEVVAAKDYTVRISAPEGAVGVEVAVDQGDWQACRPAVGYWWYDWSGYEEGEHELIARAKGPDGKTSSSGACEFFVDFRPRD